MHALADVLDHAGGHGRVGVRVFTVHALKKEEMVGLTVEVFGLLQRRGRKEGGGKGVALLCR